MGNDPVAVPPPIQLGPHLHEHSFGHDTVPPGEARTRAVLLLTSAMMVVEIAAGIAFGSMSLLADGLHMASHATALGIAVFTYWYARRHSRDPRFSFGTGKVNSLGGFTGAVLLAVFSLMMAVESFERLLAPIAIQFGPAIAVAVVGLIVNAVSALLLDVGHSHSHSDPGHHDHGEHDHNLRAAYLHVLADALTSVAAVVALTAGKYWGAFWLDPTMGIVGALLVARWSRGLLLDTSRVLLDHQAPEEVSQQVRTAIESDGDGKVADLHIWTIGAEIYAGAASVVARNPRGPAEYKGRIDPELGLVHMTIEVHQAT